MGMWREYYRLGVSSIDNQHKQLFSTVDDLLVAIEVNAGAQKIEFIIRFLKDYVVKHFNDEEAYQDSINYSGRAGHKIAHKIFKKSVLSYEKRLIESNYDKAVVKDLAGMLTMWLSYHVAGDDQKIVKGEALSTPSKATPYIETVCSSIVEVLQTMTGGNFAKSNNQGFSTEMDIIAEVGLIGGIKGKICFGFSESIACNLIEKMAFIRVDRIDELAYSALGELANIASGNATVALASRGVSCDITTPIVSSKHNRDIEASFKDGAVIDTPIGKISVVVHLE